MDSVLITDYDRISPVCEEFDVSLVIDAAESLGATYDGRPAGTAGRAAILSFNGNKIITTSGGGMLVTDDAEFAEKVRFWATQARDPAPHYEHSELGYNYRLSNLLAAVGRGQLEGLAAKVDRRRSHNEFYRQALGDLPGVSFMPEAPKCRSTFWLTALLIDPALAGCTREDVRLALESENIESRPVWKPMHLQPVFSQWRRGCLPMGSACPVGRVCRTRTARASPASLGAAFCRGELRVSSPARCRVSSAVRGDECSSHGCSEQL